MRRWMTAGVVGIVALLAGSAALAQQSGPLAYTPDGKMIFPQDYRSWVYLSTGLDMSYLESAAPSVHVFDNVFVDRQAYDSFRKTGVWPDGTVMVLEVRGAGTNPFNQRGQFQGETIINVETHVKDAAKGGWAFYGFGKGREPAPVIAKSANCYSCHEQHAATDTTFTQFYPTLSPAK